MTTREENIQKAKDHFGKILVEQLDRVERMKQAEDWLDYAKVKPLIIGTAGGDGIGPFISQHAHRILEFLLQEEQQEEFLKQVAGQKEFHMGLI